MQELILEPYAGLVFGLTPGANFLIRRPKWRCIFGYDQRRTSLHWTEPWQLIVGGCRCRCSLSLVVIAALGLGGTTAFSIAVVVGFFNGMFAVGAIGSMMSLAGEGRRPKGTV